LFSFILKQVKCRETASDLTQDTFLNVFKSAKHYSGNGKFRSWLYRIARNVCNDEYRRRAPASILRMNSVCTTEDSVSEDGRADRVDALANPAAEVERAELEILIRQALDSLPESQRLAFILCQYHGLSYPEIAVIQDCPVGTVKSRIHTALEKIRQALREHDLL